MREGRGTKAVNVASLLIFRVYCVHPAYNQQTPPCRFTESIQDMKMKIIANLESFGDKIVGSDKFSPDKAQMFYNNLNNFLKAFKKARKENEEMKIQAEKEAKRVKDKAAKDKKKESGGGKEGGKGGGQKKDLFAAFKTAQAGNTDDIVNEFQMRLAKRKGGGGSGLGDLT